MLLPDTSIHGSVRLAHPIGKKLGRAALPGPVQPAFFRFSDGGRGGLGSATMPARAICHDSEQGARIALFPEAGGILLPLSFTEVHGLQYCPTRS
jgi:hypothetical protein